MKYVTCGIGNSFYPTEALRKRHFNVINFKKARKWHSEGSEAWAKWGCEVISGHHDNGADANARFGIMTKGEPQSGFPATPPDVPVVSPPAADCERFIPVPTNGFR